MIAEHEAMKALQTELAEIDAAEHAHREHVAALLLPYQQAMGEWTLARDEALAAGKPIPVEPTAPDTSRYDSVPAHYQALRTAIRDKEKAVLAEIASEIEEEAKQRERLRMDRDSRHVRALEKDQAEVNADLADLRRVRSAVDLLDPNKVLSAGYRSSDRTHGHLTLAEYVEAVSQGVALSDLKPLQGRPEPVQRADPHDGPPPREILLGGRIPGLGSPPPWPQRSNRGVEI